MLPFGGTADPLLKTKFSKPADSGHLLSCACAWELYDRHQEGDSNFAASHRMLLDEWKLTEVSGNGKNRRMNDRNKSKITSFRVQLGECA